MLATRQQMSQLVAFDINVFRDPGALARAISHLPLSDEFKPEPRLVTAGSVLLEFALKADFAEDLPEHTFGGDTSRRLTAIKDLYQKLDETRRIRTLFDFGAPFWSTDLHIFRPR